MPSTNTLCMPSKCIYSHAHKVFMMWSHIQVYKGNIDIYGPLWTPSSICAVWTYFSQYSLCFSFLSFSQKTLSFPHHQQSHDRHFPSLQYHVCPHPLYILLFAPHSPVICKDFFSLIYMYKSSQYYAVFNINLGSIFPQSTSL